MALNVKPENLRDEIEAATKFRDEHLEHLQLLLRRYVGRYYSKSMSSDAPSVENAAYEYISMMIPSLVYDNPKCRIVAADPSVTDPSGTTMRDIAFGIQSALNRWSVDSEIADVLADGCLDYLFSWAAFMVTTADQPGYSGAELVPRKPHLIHLSHEHMVMDAAAKSHNPMQHDGPRWMGHMWRADKEDLLQEEGWNNDVIEALAADTDLEKYDASADKRGYPKRKEIVAWDIWVPELGLSDEPGFNGSIYTIAAGASGGGITKNRMMIREPRPAFCPPWGPYIMVGAYRVPGSPFPLGPLVAVAEQAEEVNAHASAAARDAKNYKRFSYSDSKNAADADRVKKVQHGEHVLLDDPASFGQAEVGGVSDAQYRYIPQARERLERALGMSEAMRGQPRARVTATAEARAAAGSSLRIDGLKRQYRKGVAAIFKTAAWYIFYGEDQIHGLLAEDGGGGRYEGGLQEGQEAVFRFYDLSLEIDPLSIEHTDQMVLQNRVQTAFDLLTKTAAAMPEMPWVKWREPIRMIYESLNINSADEWIDWQMLAAIQQARMGGQPPQGQPAARPAAPSPAMPGDTAAQQMITMGVAPERQAIPIEASVVSAAKRIGRELGLAAGVT